MASDQFLTDGILSSLFEAFTPICVHTEHDQQLQAFHSVIQPVRDVYHTPLLQLQERFRSLEEQFTSAQQNVTQLMQLVHMTQMANQNTITQLEQSNSRWNTDREAAARTEQKLREAAARTEQKLREEMEMQHRYALATQETLQRDKEALQNKLTEEGRRFRQEEQRSADWEQRFRQQEQRFRQEEQRYIEREERSKQVEQRLVKESERWYNEYRNARTASYQDESRLKLKGSESRAQVWKKLRDEPTLNSLNQELKVTKNWTYDDAAISRLLNSNSSNKLEMYDEFVALLSSHLEKPIGPNCPGVQVLDTHNRFYLRGLAPDITISVGGVLSADPASVYLVIEVKMRDDATSDPENLGQLVDYLLELRTAQPHRRRFAGILTNFKSNVVVILESFQDARECITHHTSVDLQTALNFIQETALAHPSYRPPTRGFSLDLGVMLRRLGTPTNSVVAEFHQRNAGQRDGERMAVKRSHADSSFIWSELRVLRMIREEAPERIARILPTLVYESPDGREFGITPVGAPLLAHYLPSPAETRQILHDVLDALIWLHNLSEPLIHRDVRSQNIILSHRKREKTRAILIDFDQVAISGIETTYRGGYLCCPRELIGNVQPLTLYTPAPKHDYEAFVLLANMLAFPGRRTWGVQWNEVTKDSDASRRLLTFWGEIENSPLWSPYLKAATDEEPDLLRTMCEFFVYI